MPVWLERYLVIWAEKANTVKERIDYSLGKPEGWLALKSNVVSEKMWGVKIRGKEFWTEERELLALSTPLN